MPREKKGISFEKSYQVQLVAKKLIETVHTHLAKARVLFLLRDGRWASKGNVIMGDAYKVSGKEKFFTSGMEGDAEGYDFYVMINKETWESLRKGGENEEFTPSIQQIALVDHQLCHCIYDGDDKGGNPIWKKQDHDFHGFHSEIKRNGLWQSDLELMNKALEGHKQETIFADHPQLKLATN